jgi:NodT family efflux transporter outer membrane factor (OMF) lipoprotein
VGRAWAALAEKVWGNCEGWLTLNDHGEIMMWRMPRLPIAPDMRKILSTHQQRSQSARPAQTLGPSLPVTASRFRGALLSMLALVLSGCTSLHDYVHHGFKVGPNYGRPAAAVADQWIDATDQRVRTEEDDPTQWWTVFNDPVLNSLVCSAYHENLTLREAGFRVLQARAQLDITTGQIFPQTQTMTGQYSRNAISEELVNSHFLGKSFNSQWRYGFNLNWELDFWGRFRRAIESNAATLDASVEDYDDVLVTLVADVANDYVQIRTLQERIEYAQKNLALQEETLTLSEARFRGGTTSELDVYQAKSTVEQTQAEIQELEISLRQTVNNLCVLLGQPPQALTEQLGPRPVPTAPPDVVVGIPADLLRRRPDVRRAERQAAAQSAQIGIAESDFYPAISINGTLGYSAQYFPDLFHTSALNGNVGPSFQWNLLNYGRILNNVRLQDARFQELVATYQQTVLDANQEVENGLVSFLRAQQRMTHQSASVADTEKAVEIVLAQYRGGTADFTRVSQVEQALVQQQDVLAQVRGEIASGLIQVFRALGGGWQIRLTDCTPTPLPGTPAAPATPEALPTPSDVPPTVPAEQS